jgi:glycine cleavage system H protein
LKENDMSEVRYTEQHEWIAADGTVGITKFAVEQLGDVVFVELPDVGKALKLGDEAAVVESVKAASEIYAPVGGEVVEANAALGEEPAKLNADPEGDAWIFKLQIADAGELAKLMTAAQYAEFVKGQ